MRWLLAAAFLLAGIGHLVATDSFMAIVPPWVPFPRQTVLATGIAEIAGALALLTPRWRRLAGGALALYAVCVFPANIRHAVEGIAVGGTALGWGYHAPRLLFQPVIVWAALFAGGLIDWPWRNRL